MMAFAREQEVDFHELADRVRQSNDDWDVVYDCICEACGSSRFPYPVPERMMWGDENKSCYETKEYSVARWCQAEGLDVSKLVEAEAKRVSDKTDQMHVRRHVTLTASDRIARHRCELTRMIHQEWTDAIADLLASYGPPQEVGEAMRDFLDVISDGNEWKLRDIKEDLDPTESKAVDKIAAEAVKKGLAIKVSGKRGVYRIR